MALSVLWADRHRPSYRTEAGTQAHEVERYWIARLVCKCGVEHVREGKTRDAAVEAVDKRVANLVRARGINPGLFANEDLAECDDLLEAEDKKREPAF